MSVYRDRDKRLKAPQWRYRARITLASGERVRVRGTPSLNTKEAARDAERAHIHRVLHAPPPPPPEPKPPPALPAAVTELPEPNGAPGYVYFITDGELVKIGYSEQLPRRLAGLQTANPRQLRLVKAIPGTVEDEALLHDRHQPHHVRGEWYRAEPVFATEGIA
jgi:hypothetical protein